MYPLKIIASIMFLLGAHCTRPIRWEIKKCALFDFGGISVWNKLEGH